MHQLKKNNFDLKVLLSNSYYELDAAKRVISNLMTAEKEPLSSNENAMDLDLDSSDPLISSLDKCAKELSAGRKNREKTVVTLDQLSKFQITSTISSKSINPSADLTGNMLICGGKDGKISVRDLSDDIKSVSSIKVFS